MNTYNNVKYVRETIKRSLINPKIIVDATAGNGNDTLFLAKSYPKSKIYAFDIQSHAIENTQKRCSEYNNIFYIIDSHSNVDKHIKEGIDLVIFNLGYLPNSSEKIVTQFNSTKEAIDKSLERLNKNGLIVLTLYKGIENIDETNKLKDYLKDINKDIYIVSNYQLFNLKDAPENIIIERK